MKKLLIRFALATFLVSGLVEAGDWHRPAKGLAPLAPPVTKSCSDCLSYDFIDLEYVNTSYSNPWFENGDGYGFSFSKSLGCKYYLNGGFRDSGYDYDWIDHILPVESRSFRLGVGRRFEISKCIDLTFEGGVEHFDTEYDGPHAMKNFDSWSYYFGPGVRARAGRLEVYANAFFFSREGDAAQDYLAMHSAVHGTADEDGWLFTPGLIYHFNDRFGFKVGGEFTTHTSTLLLGGRFNF